MANAVKRALPILTAATIGFCLTYAYCWFGDVGRPLQSDRLSDDYMPMAYHVPKVHNGASFRFAMAHDIIHERYPRHGEAHFRERERLTRENLTKLTPDETDYFAAMDDLAVALDRHGRLDEAVKVMRDKLARQQAKNLAGGELYTTTSNLGTALVHDSFRKWLAGDAGAKAPFREGANLIRKSVEIYPLAHFGRQQWEAAFAEYLAAAMDDPTLLTKFDFVGDRLDRGMKEIMKRNDSMGDGYGRLYVPHAVWVGPARYQFPKDLRPDDPDNWSQLLQFRNFITRIGAEGNWPTINVPSHREPVPFDEPALGIVSMWRQTAGPNPHLALALGEIMLRVGQRYIAWTAFERASRFADQFWPDAKIQQALREHCQKRQDQIEESLRHDGQARKAQSPEPIAANLRAQFDAELAYGEKYQREYQEYEAAKLGAGASIDDEHLFDEFNAGREPIASHSGAEEWYATIPRPDLVMKRRLLATMAWSIAAAGAAALALSLLLQFRRPRKEPQPSRSE